MTVIRVLTILLATSTSLVEGCRAGAGGAAAGAAAGAAGNVGRHLGENAGAHIAEHVGLHVGGAFLGRCIHEEADVRMADGMKKKVKHLEIGDEVLAYEQSKGIHVSRVSSDLHNDKDTLVPILEIKTSTGRLIPLTPQHSLFARECLSDGREWTAKSARDIRVGDCLPRYYEGEKDVVEEAVVDIRVFEAKGIRQPVTETGTIVVDDIVVSCYDRVVSQQATHLVMLVYRWFSNVKSNYSKQVTSIVPTLFNFIGANSLF
jgi:hypothetical protein